MMHRIAKLKNLLLFNLCYRLGVARLPYPPLMVNLEPTNLCNLRCPMCPVSQNADNPEVDRGLMDMELFGHLAGKLAPHRPRVALNMGGESTLHPRLPEMVARLKEDGMYVLLDTNATRIDRALSTELVSAGLDEIVFCLDGRDEESYESIRVRARFDEVVANIREFLRVKAERGARRPHTVVKNIRYYDPEDRAGFPERFAQLFSDRPPDEFRFTWADHWPGEHRSGLRDPYDVQPFGDEYHPCVNLWKKLAISWDGVVHICCLDLNRTSPVGNLAERDVLSVWNDPEMVRLRRVHAEDRQAELPLCHNCNQIRRAPDRAGAGLWSVGGDRFTPWVKEERTGDRSLPVVGRRGAS